MNEWDETIESQRSIRGANQGNPAFNMDAVIATWALGSAAHQPIDENELQDSFDRMWDEIDDLLGYQS